EQGGNERRAQLASSSDVDGDRSHRNADHEQRNGKQMMQADAPFAEPEGGAEPDAVAAHVRGEQLEQREESDGVDEAADRPEQQRPENRPAHGTERRRARAAINAIAAAPTTPQAKTSP